MFCIHNPKLEILGCDTGYRPSNHQGGGPRGLTRSTIMEIKANYDGCIWTIARINLLHILCNKLGTQSVSPIVLCNPTSLAYIKENRDLGLEIDTIRRSNLPRS